MKDLNYKNAILCVLSIFLIFGLSCTSTPAADNSGGGGGSTQTVENYLVTSDGFNPTVQPLATEYDEFLILEGETSRKIYFGGRATSQSNLDNIEYFWLVDQVPSKLWDYQYEGESITEKWEEPGVGLYYSGDFLVKEPTQSSSTSETETIELKVGYYDLQNQRAVITTKDVEFRYEDANARDFPVDVYEQSSHNFWNEVATDVISAFSRMGVGLIPNLVNSTLANRTFSLSNTVNVEEEYWEYAMEIVYPEEDYEWSKTLFLANNSTGKGLAFVVENYTDGPSDPTTGLNTILGITWPGGNGIKWPSFTFIFSGAINDLFNADWEMPAKRYNAIHELGHLWCINFTDENTHEYWHNGDNKSQCVMRSFNVVIDAPNGYPDTEHEKALNFHNFCEGHLQRGMNISWKLQQYDPYGEQTGGNMPMNSTYLASTDKNFTFDQLSSPIDVQINTDQKEYIKGELFQIDVRISNKGTDPIALQAPKQYQLNVKHIEDNVEFTVKSAKPSHLWSRDLPSGKYYTFSISPAKRTTYTEAGIDEFLIPGCYWKEGTYQLELVVFGKDNRQYTSNVTEFIIHPLPVEYEETFEFLLLKKRQELGMKIPEILRVISEDRHARFRYELFYLVYYQLPKRFFEQPAVFRKALMSLILEKPNKQFIIQYLRNVDRYINESNDLQAIAAHKTFLADLADSVAVLKASEPQKYEQLQRVLSGREEQVFGD